MLRQLVLGSLADGGIFVVLLGGVVAVLAIVVLATYIVRLALVVLLVVAAPICLVCHALPQTEGLARLWWRAFAGALAVQVAQSLVLVTALRVFLASGGPANLGIASTGGVVDLLVSACLCWVLVKIPAWVSRVVFSGSRGHRGMSRVVRDVIIYKGVKALAAGVGAVTAPRPRQDRGRVRIPADVERPDRLLAGLTARQLAILAVAGVVLWAGYAATRHLRPAGRLRRGRPSRSVRVAAMLALGRFEGVAADRWVARRLAPPPRPAPAGARPRRRARRRRPSSAPTRPVCRRRCVCRSPASAPTGSSTSAPTGWPSSAGPAR